MLSLYDSISLSRRACRFSKSRRRAADLMLELVVEFMAFDEGGGNEEELLRPLPLFKVTALAASMSSLSFLHGGISSVLLLGAVDTVMLIPEVNCLRR